MIGEDCIELEDDFEDVDVSYDPLEKWNEARSKKKKLERPGWVQDVDERHSREKSNDKTSPSAADIAKDLYYSEKLRLFKELNEIQRKTEMEKQMLIEEQVHKEKYEKRLLEKYYEIKIHSQKEKYKFYKRQVDTLKNSVPEPVICTDDLSSDTSKKVSETTLM